MKGFGFFLGYLLMSVGLGLIHQGLILVLLGALFIFESYQDNNNSKQK